MKACFIIPVLFFLLSAGGCTDKYPPAAEIENGRVSILIHCPVLNTRIVDEDNLASEQYVNKIALFFTEPLGDVVTHKYTDVGFTTSGDYKIITLPVEASELATRDIYVVTNYDTVNLDRINTITALRDVKTPQADKNVNLDPERGLCMFGKLESFDFVAAAGTPPIVAAERTCAKIRVNMRFPEDQTDSSNNSFLITDAARYTFIVSNSAGVALPSDSYFNFAAPIDLPYSAATGTYVNTAYVYEASRAPTIYFYTNLAGSTQPEQFSTTLPIPMRNYLYDLDVRIYETETRQTVSAYPPEATLIIYDGAGNKTCESTLQVKLCP